MSLVVQSVRVNKSIPKIEANKVVKKMGYKATRPDKIKNPQYKNYHSYRQVDPNKFKKGSFRIKKISPTVLMVFGVLK
tara:strand:- start:51 stop:284 length:234 start_codon:yes stop_codon:yes gene_type:complete